MWMKRVYQKVGLIAAILFAELQICIFWQTGCDRIGIVWPVGRRTLEGATAAGRLFCPHLFTKIINPAKVFGRGGRVVWEQQLQVSLSNLIHPSVLSIPQSSLAWDKRAVYKIAVENFRAIISIELECFGSGASIL